MTLRSFVLPVALAGLSWALVRGQEPVQTRSVEARFSDDVSYVPCALAPGSEQRLVQKMICGGGLTPKREEAPARSLERRRGGAGIADSDIALNERRAAEDPKNPRAWNDLAASYLSRAQVEDDPRDLLRAQEAIRRSLALDDKLLAARFNLGLTLEKLYLPKDASEAWDEYLKLDPSSAWSVEAHERLWMARSRAEAVTVWSEQLEALKAAAREQDADRVRAIVGQYRQAAREHAEQILFAQWGAAELAGRQADAMEHLDLLRSIGDALALTSGETLVRDSVSAIDQAQNTRDDARLEGIARGAVAFGNGYKLYRNRDSDPRPELSLALNLLKQYRCPLAWRADFYLASDHYVASRYRETVESANQLLGRMEAEGVSYRAIRAHLYWIRGMAEATLGRTKEGLADLDQSFQGFRTLGEKENAANLNCRLGDVLMSRGRKSEAWNRIYRALRATPELRDYNQLASVYSIASNAALQDSFDDAAFRFQAERVRQAGLTDQNVPAFVEALTSFARLLHHRGENPQARQVLATAVKQTSTIQSSETRTRRMADIRMIQGILIEKENPDQAVRFLSEALSVYQSEKNVIFSLWTHLERGRAFRLTGDTTKAEADFAAALGHYAEMGARLREEDLRLALLEQTDAVFDEMISLQADRLDWNKVFAYADRARTQILPGSASKLWTGASEETQQLLDTEPQPRSLDEIRSGLPAGVTLVQYSVLPDRLLILTLRRDGQEIRHSLPLERKTLEAKVARFRAFDATAGRELFELLIQPWLASVPEGDLLVFVPDKSLHWIAFSALRDAGGRYLIESHPLVVEPSATFYVSALERRGALPPALSSNGLVVGNPEVDHNVLENRTLPSLEWAEKEAQNIADQTQAQFHLSRGQATLKDFLKRAPTVEWIHYSGHAVIDPDNTLLSRLVFASSPGDNGSLTAREIYRLKLPKTQLVVLAGCDTGNEHVPGGEGTTSLARAFLAAGVPTIVASLWSVNDQPTGELIRMFHEELKPGIDPAEALRRAQIQMLGKQSSPKAWAAFEVIGASAGGTR